MSVTYRFLCFLACSCRILIEKHRILLPFWEKYHLGPDRGWSLGWKVTFENLSWILWFLILPDSYQMSFFVSAFWFLISVPNDRILVSATPKTSENMQNSIIIVFRLPSWIRHLGCFVKVISDSLSVTPKTVIYQILRWLKSFLVFRPPSWIRHFEFWKTEIRFVISDLENHFQQVKMPTTAHKYIE